MTEYRRDDRVVGPRQRVGTVLYALGAARGGPVLVEFDGEHGRETFHSDSPDIRRASLVRTGRLGMIHRQECSMARRGNAVPWLWADDNDPVTVKGFIKAMRYRTCDRCRPIGVK